MVAPFRGGMWLIICVACISPTGHAQQPPPLEQQQQTASLHMPAIVNQIRFYSAFQNRLVREACGKESRAKGDAPLKQCMDNAGLTYKLPRVAASVPRCVADRMARNVPRQAALAECLAQGGAAASFDLPRPRGSAADGPLHRVRCAVLMVVSPRNENDIGRYTEAINSDWAKSHTCDTLVARVMAGGATVAWEQVASVMAAAIESEVYDRLLWVPPTLALVSDPRRAVFDDGLSPGSGGTDASVTVFRDENNDQDRVLHTHEPGQAPVLVQASERAVAWLEAPPDDRDDRDVRYASAHQLFAESFSPTEPLSERKAKMKSVLHLTSDWPKVGTNGTGKADDSCYRIYVRKWGEFVCAPHFVVIGAPKAGSTSLYHYLMQHGDVVESEKEHFYWGTLFDPNRSSTSSQRLLEQAYLPHFPKISPGDGTTGNDDDVGEAQARSRRVPIAGELSPFYLYLNERPIRSMRALLPAVRLVALLREPVGRAYSEYMGKFETRSILSWYQHRWGQRQRLEHDRSTERVPDFGRLVHEARVVMAECPRHTEVQSMMDRPRDYNPSIISPPSPCFLSSFVVVGCYSRFLRRWLQIFPREQLLVLDAAELATDPTGAMRTIATHLGLASDGPAFDSIDTSQVYNVAGARGCGLSAGVSRGLHHHHATARVLDDASFCILESFYAPFNRELTGLLLENNYAPMSWANSEGGPRPELQCPGLWGAPLNASVRVTTRYHVRV